MAIHIIDEANRCLNCKKPKCMEGCPVHTPVPHIIQLFKEHQVMDAGRELFENNPMSLICSIVCIMKCSVQGTVFWEKREVRYTFPVLKPIFPICIWTE